MGRLACVLALGIAAAVAACAGDSPKDTSCKGALYDPCATEHDCTATGTTCMPVGSFEVCTKPCTPGDNSTCPKQGGSAATCNAAGLCEPAAPNSCTMP